MIVECEIAVEPQNIQNGLHTIPDHRRPAEKAKGNKALDILGHMGRDGGSDGVPGDLLVPQAMSWGEA